MPPKLQRCSGSVAFTAAATAPFSKSHLVQLKYDGSRAVLDNGQLFSRSQRNVTRLFPTITEYPLPPGTVLDGELVAFKPGKTSLSATLSAINGNRPSHNVTFYVFDLLWLAGENLALLSLEHRLELLEELKLTGVLEIAARIDLENYSFIATALPANCDGLVLKHRESIYHSPRPDAWLKCKPSFSASFKVLDLEPGNRDGFGHLLIGLYHQGDWLPVGRVGSGFSSQEIEAVVQRFQRGETIIVEVGYSNFDTGHLRHPVFLGIRTDVAPEDCTVLQLLN